MYILGNLIIAIGVILNKIIEVMYFVLIIRVILSWVRPDPYNFFVQLLYKITEPILYPFRRIIPLRNIGLDISPMLAMMALFFVQQFLIMSLIQLGYQLGGKVM